MAFLFLKSKNSSILLLSITTFLFQATRPDMIRILSAALHVVLRRDMSLNRRLYAWLLGRYLMNMLIIDKRNKTAMHKYSQIV